VANAGGPYSATAGVALNFNAGGSTDPQGETLTYAWNFGDNGTATGVSPTHTYTSPGTYTVSLTVTNTSNLTATATSKATIAPAPPVANAGGTYTGTVGTAVSFNGSGSSDPQGETLTYAWNFGDNGTGTGVNPTHTYATSGTYTVSLTVTNTSNLSATATNKATIASDVPTANAGGPYTGTVGIAVSFNGSGSSDPQGETLTYVWSFGESGMGTGVSPTYTFATPGTYTITLAVTNTSKLTGIAYSTATIAAVPPVANTGGPYTGIVGTAVSFSGAASTDPQGETLTYAWNFGDSGTGTGVSPTHIYATAGMYTVSLTVTNTSNLSNTTTSTATIATAPPVAHTSGPYAGTAGTAVSFSGSRSSDPQGEALNYAWNFGDSGTGIGVSPTHTYTTPGTYTVTLTVTNTSNLSNTATSTATITIAQMTNVALTGLVYGGASPIAGAHVYLFAANTTGYGGVGIAASSSNASISLLSAAETGTSDSVGAYVATGSNGGFSLTGDGTCTSGQQLYLYVLGGNNGSGTNAAAGLMAAIGSCPASGSSAITVTVNEVSTIAAAYAFAGFATDATHVSSSGTALAQVGIANAFANAANLVSLLNGTALATTPAGNGTVPQTEINTLANILANCVETSGPGSNGCTLLFTNAKSGGSIGTAPTDTATAAINIAHNPGSNIAALYALAASTQPFTPVLATQTYDFTMSLWFAGHMDPTAISIDSAGNAWVANYFGNYVTELSSTGRILSGTNGYTGGGLLNPNGITLDASGNAWITNNGANSVTELSNTGQVLSGANGYPGFGQDNPGIIAFDPSGDAWVLGNGGILKLSSSGAGLSGAGYDFNYSCYGLAIDVSGNAWIPIDIGMSGGVLKMSNTGVILSGAQGYQGGGLNSPWGIAIDASGNVWVTNAGNNNNLGSNNITEFSNSGVVLSGSNGFSGGGLTNPFGIVIDGSGNIWVEDAANIVEFSNSGTLLSGAYGYSIGIGYPGKMAIDSSGNLWLIGDSTDVMEVLGIATPVVTPLAVGVKNNTLGTRP
jgi:PKD repeat protein